MVKIYLCCSGEPPYVTAYAMAEDGEVIAGHVSTNADFAKFDMGLTSNRKHDTYKACYPDGYELEWIDDVKEHPGYRAALALNKARVTPERSEALDA